MGKSLFEFFEEKFRDNLRGATPPEAFEKTIEEIGFQPYSSYKSFASVRTKKRRAIALRNR